MPDGRSLVFYTNTFTPENPTVFEANHFALHQSMSKAGLTLLPEVEAKDARGNVMSNHTAVYVDHRIGIDIPSKVVQSASNAAPKLFRLGGRPANPGETDLLVSDAINFYELHDLIALCRPRPVVPEVGKIAIGVEQVYETGL